MATDLTASSLGISQVTAIDTDTNSVAYVRSNKPGLVFDQLEVSPDSKTLYLLNKSNSKVVLWDAAAGDPLSSINVTAPSDAWLDRGTGWMAKPQTDNNNLYVMQLYDVDRASTVLGIAQLDISQRKQVRVVKASPYNDLSGDSFTLALSTDEKKIFYPATNSITGPQGGFLSLDLASGKLSKLASFTTPTNVTEMLALDNDSLVFGNGNAGNGPTKVDIKTGTINAIPMPPSYLTIKGYDHLAAANPKDIFASNISSIWQSTLQNDGSYSGKLLSVRGSYVAGTLNRPIAFARAH
ncbi:YncE family protein [Caballeronia sp. M23-90]